MTYTSTSPWGTPQRVAKFIACANQQSTLSAVSGRFGMLNSDGSVSARIGGSFLLVPNAHPAMHHGAVSACAAEGDLLTLERAADGDTVRCLFNFGTGTVELDGITGRVLAEVNGATPDRLPPFGALVLENSR